jgi:hypothetical protein
MAPNHLSNKDLPQEPLAKNRSDVFGERVQKAFFCRLHARFSTFRPL